MNLLRRNVMHLYVLFNFAGMKNLPEAFLERMKLRFNEKEFESFQNSYESETQTSIRLNPKKQMDGFSDLPEVSWLKNGKILPEKKLFITDPLWHAGAYYVQETSSMILGEIFGQIYAEEKPKRALDLCAAPGGKSTLLQSLLDENSVLVANEVIKPRAQILKENHIRLGISENLIITQNDPKDFSGLDEFFDYIQIDAPCSGEGMFRRDEIARKEWSESNCSLCSERSKRILADIQNVLCKDGYLVYSTCTFNPKENEELMDWFCEEFDFESVKLDFNPDWGISEVDVKGIFGYYFYPHKVKGEGLFVSVMKKKSGFGLQSISNSKKRNSLEIDELIQSENIVQENDAVIWETEELRAVKNQIKNRLNVVYAGIELGEMKGKDFIPAQALANFHKKLHHFPPVEVDEKKALEFLRGNDPDLELEEKGIYLLTYQDLGLGFVKFIGNRSNNYYPKPWRIKNY